jgi:hypothetical protein
MLKAVSVQIVEMILHVSLGGFFCMLLRVQMLRVRQVRVMAGLLVVAALVKLGCLLPVASRLFVVLRWRVMVCCSRDGNRKIRCFGVSGISDREACSLGMTFHSCVWTDLAGRPFP